MKNLINKIFLTGMIGAGSLGIFGNVRGQKIEDDTIYNKNKELTELEKFNLENKQIYDDFIQFVKEKGNTPESGVFVLEYDENPKEYCDSSLEIIFSDEDKYLSLEKRDSCVVTRFITDHGVNGLNPKEKDESKKPARRVEYLFDKSGNIIKSTGYPNYKTFSEDAIGHAREYTSLLKTIMHKGGHPKYQ